VISFRGCGVHPCLALFFGGVAADEKFADFKQQIIAATSDQAPQTKVMEFDHAVDVQTLLERACASSAN